MYDKTDTHRKHQVSNWQCTFQNGFKLVCLAQTLLYFNIITVKACNMPNLMQIKNQAATLLADKYQEYPKCFISILCQFYLAKVPGVISICMYISCYCIHSTFLSHLRVVAPVLWCFSEANGN